MKDCALCGSEGKVIGRCSLCEMERTEGCGRTEPEEVCCECAWEADQS